MIKAIAETDVNSFMTDFSVGFAFDFILPSFPPKSKKIGQNSVKTGRCDSFAEVKKLLKKQDFVIESIDKQGKKL